MWEGLVRPAVKEPRQVTTTALPDLHRITGQRIVLGTDRAECTVFGRRHRRPVEQRVPLAVAVELARRGVSTVVRVAEA